MSYLTSLDSALALQSIGTLKPPASSQGANSAIDPQADLFAQALAQSLQAPNSTFASQPPSPGNSTAGAMTSPSGSTPISSDWTALNQALSSNNISAAQLAFQSLQTDLQSTQSTHHHHHRHHSGAAQGQGSNTGTITPTTDTQSASGQTSLTNQGSATESP